MSKDIISILESNEPHNLKDAVYSVLSQKMMEALDDYKFIVARNYFGQDLAEGALRGFKAQDLDAQEKKRLEKPKRQPYQRIKQGLNTHNLTTYSPSAKKASVKEESDLQELSRKTLGSYVKKAAPEIDAHAAQQMHHLARQTDVANRASDIRSKLRKSATDKIKLARYSKDSDYHREKADRHVVKANNRIQGVQRAADRLTKEDLEEAKKKAATPKQQQKAIDKFVKDGKYKERSSVRFSPLRYKKDRHSARLNSQARYNSSPESESYWSS
jgi:hypothetical protein